ncbi:MAG: phosphate acyltransferase PlsX [Erysipelotrichaceae bacterium]|nr:phosphate acyltransferase PlsX [Erysipelotrichaceae bacterium]
MKIAVDAMGGDNGSKVVVTAVKQFLIEFPGVEVVVFGDKNELEQLTSLCQVIDAPETVPMEAGALEVIRMKNSSMCVALKTMKEQQFDAVVSAGSTGGYLAAATLILKLIPGVRRAALVTSFPTKLKDKKLVVLDIGANNENSPEELVQFAEMGRTYHQSLYNSDNPKTYLLSNGTEAHKGSPVGQAAYKLLLETQFPNFCGNMEARDALTGEADILVTDGYTGNVFLKSSEGIAKLMSAMIKDNFKKNLWTKLGYLHVAKGFKEMSTTMNYKTTGGAMLLGVNGVVVKAHGNSDVYGFTNALRVAKTMVERRVVETIKEMVKRGQ